MNDTSFKACLRQNLKETLIVRIGRIPSCRAPERISFKICLFSLRFVCVRTLAKVSKKNTCVRGNLFGNIVCFPTKMCLPCLDKNDYVEDLHC